MIQQTVQSLAEEEMQSDLRFGESFVRNRIDRGAGPLRVKAEMMARGLDDEVIEQSLSDYKEWWRDLAVEVYQKRYKGSPPEDNHEKTKRMAFLQSRGFTADQIRYAVSQSSDESE